MNPGWNVVLPIIHSYSKIDIRTKAVDVPEQEAITRDNVSVRINAVIYYKIFDASKAVLAVENYYYAVGQLAQTTMRNIVGSVSLDELLVEREKISLEKLRSFVGSAGQSCPEGMDAQEYVSRLREDRGFSGRG